MLLLVGLKRRKKPPPSVYQQVSPKRTCPYAVFFVITESQHRKCARCIGVRGPLSGKHSLHGTRVGKNHLDPKTMVPTSPPAMPL